MRVVKQQADEKNRKPFLLQFPPGFCGFRKFPPGVPPKGSSFPGDDVGWEGWKDHTMIVVIFFIGFLVLAIVGTEMKK